MTLCITHETGGIRSSVPAMRSSPGVISFAQRIASELIANLFAIPAIVSHGAMVYDFARSLAVATSHVPVGLVSIFFFICVTVSKSVLTSHDLFI
jgi:hypothetical protein